MGRSFFREGVAVRWIMREIREAWWVYLFGGAFCIFIGGCVSPWLDRRQATVKNECKQEEKGGIVVEESNCFQMGDVVALRCTGGCGPYMVVEEVDGQCVGVAWFNANNEIRREELHAKTLHLVHPAKENSAKLQCP